MLIFDFSPDSYRDKISDFTPGCEATGKQAFKKRRTGNRTLNGATQRKPNQGSIAGIKILTLNL
jgi:hypothetical protein